MERINVPPIEGTCHDIRLLCTDFYKLNNSKNDLCLCEYERDNKRVKFP